jgi:hypothetical protein
MNGEIRGGVVAVGNGDWGMAQNSFFYFFFLLLL